MTTTNAAPMDRRRPTLSDQIDRLDATLDGLAEGLNEAVADAVKAAVGAAVREAVQATLAEVLTHPDVLARLAATPPPHCQAAPPPLPGRMGLRERLGRLWRRLREGVAGLRDSGRAGLRRVAAWLGGLEWGVAGGCAALWARCRSLAAFRYELLTALGVGVGVAAAAWFAGPSLAAALSGAGGFVATLAVQGWLWLRRALTLHADPATPDLL